MKSLNELAKEVHQTAIEHGWWEREPDFGTIIALIHSELSEAFEEYRNNKPMAYFKRNSSTFSQYESNWIDETNLSLIEPTDKLEGISTELVDVIIRILDYCAFANIDIEEIIRIKMAYNKTRPYKRGGKIV